ncbi:MAG: class I SAM-dependent methyltransferase [Chitinophagaceae bacterium]|nr:class I SAM-dependent methyltransferase [Chitinophagaceae bacterium]
MAEQAWYKEWFNSPYYHKLYFERDEKEAEAFIRKLVEHLQPAACSRMLDIACGRGRHSRTLSSMGFEVTGIDLSVSSIEYAKKFENEKLEFFVHDMRLPFRANYYDYAFNFFTSFGYFRTRREHDDAMRTIVESLHPRGCFVIDYLNVHYSEAHLVPNEIKILGDTRYEIHRWEDEDYFFKRIIVTDPSLPEPFDNTEQVAKFSLGDLTDMLAFQGMQVKEVYGDYAFSPFDIKKTPRLILIASRAEMMSGDKEKRIYSDGRPADALT